MTDDGRQMTEGEKGRKKNGRKEGSSIKALGAAIFF
jgi:hypothetical protein